MGPPVVGNIQALGPGQELAASTPPRPGWPAKSTLDYHKTLIELALLLLAVPWILRELFKHPGQVSRKAAGRHLKGT